MSRRRLVLAALLFACSPEAPPSDAGSPMLDVPVDVPDPHMGLRLPRCDDTDPAPASPLPHLRSTLEGTFVPHVDRLASPGAPNPASEAGEAAYRAMGLDVVDVGPGMAHLRREDLGATTSATTGRRSLVWLAHLSDFQLVDDESPTRLGSADAPGTTNAALRAAEAYLPRAVSATSRTFARIEAAGRDFDAAVVTGDCADSAQENELRWVIAVMNGTPGTETDSGDDDDPIPGPDNDPKDAFDPTPFPAPWLYVPGNHDVEVVGVSAPDDAARARAIGSRAPLGTRDYGEWFAPVTSGSVPADPMRRIVDRDDIVSIVRAAEPAGTPGPPGHGFPETGPVDTTLGANWTYDVVPGLLRMVALDTSDRTGGSSGMVMQATVDDWLVPELDRAVADGVLVVLASHHSARAIDPFPGQLGSDPTPGALTADELEAIVASRTEVIAWLVGHNHQNRVRAVAGPDAARPGYWEIMTSALADWPSQARAIEVVDNGDGTLSIFATLIDYDTDDCFERRFRALTQIEWAAGWSDEHRTAADAGNVELVRAIPPSALAAVTAASLTARTELESLTTLAGP